MTEYELRRRGDKFRDANHVLRQRVARLEHDLAETRHQSFCRGSAETLAAVHNALDNPDLIGFLDQRMMKDRIRKPPYKLAPETEALVRAEILDLLQRCGYSAATIKRRMKDITL